MQKADRPKFGPICSGVQEIRARRSDFDGVGATDSLQCGHDHVGTDAMKLEGIDSERGFARSDESRHQGKIPPRQNANFQQVSPYIPGILGIEQIHREIRLGGLRMTTQRADLLVIEGTGLFKVSHLASLSKPSVVSFG